MKKKFKEHYDKIESFFIGGMIMLFIPFLMSLADPYEFYSLSIIIIISFCICFIMAGLMSNVSFWRYIHDDWI